MQEPENEAPQSAPAASASDAPGTLVRYMPPEAEAGVPEAKQPWNVHARKREHDAILLSVAPDGTADLKVLPVQHPNPRIQREQIRKVLGVKFSNKPAPGCWSRT